jgi:hypothetical protein
MKKALQGLSRTILFVVVGASASVPFLMAEEKKATVDYSPYVDAKHASGVYWGDTHLHTNLSTDAGLKGNTLSPDDAYRIARGEQLVSSTGVKAKLSRPLDFLVVGEHSDGMGFIADMLSGAPNIVADPKGKEWYDRIRAGDAAAVGSEVIGLFSQGKFPRALAYTPDTPAYRNSWDRTVDSAERYNEPGLFTAFIGYEWTSLISGDNLHRVVIYKDGKDKAGLDVPYTTTPPWGSPNPRDLWKWLEAYEEKTGGEVLAIAHNGNLSNGSMFPLEAQYDGVILDKEYVEQRSKWEPLYEISQIKGDGETHPKLSPNDGFADFETWDKGNLDLSTLKQDSMLAGEYGREALKRGLAIEEKLGTNPYNFGIIGATDSHTSLAMVQENNYFGKFGSLEPSARRTSDSAKFKTGTQAGPGIQGWQQVASGLAGVWATGNTRAELFEAMERKEVYGTTGSRMTVRFFGGWDYDAKDVVSHDPASIGYAKGVPMGGDLTDAGKKSPSFMVYAQRDPIGANLDRIQVIKGWLDDKGETQEKVYDVVWSDQRKIKRGKLQLVGNTVDADTASYTNDIGAPELAVVWVDPDFDAKQKAFYYARVLEIPTPRWSTIDAVRFGIKRNEDAPIAIQDRAYTSPIWYKP